MTKPKIKGESKAERFKRIASLRTQRILNDLRLLGNCANTSFYMYDQESVSKIFATVERELKRIKVLFDKHKKTFKL